MLDVSFTNEYTIFGSHVHYESFDDLKERQGELYDTIKYLSCVNMNLTFLPKLPSALEVLVCNNNELVELPILPYGLKELYCVRNNLTKLPDLPDKLVSLWCQFNEIKKLPKLPDGLYTLVCDCNKITEFPIVPYGIQTIHCSYNKIKVLPYIPELVYIYNTANIRINNNPMSDIVESRYKNDLHLYMKEKKAVDEISNWFISCKYNPRYKYCRKRIENEYHELYD